MSFLTSESKQKAKTKLIHVSSKHRLKGNDNEYTINIGDALNDKIRGIKLQSFSFYNVFYNIRAGVNDVISIKQNGQARQNITLSTGEGYYTFAELAAQLKIDIDNALVGATVTISLTPYTKKVQFAFSASSAIVYGEDDTKSTMARSLGFSVTSADLATVVATQTPKLGGLDEVFVVSKELSGQNLVDTRTKTKRPVIAVIPNNGPFLSQKFWENQDDLDVISYGDPRAFSNVEIRFENSLGELLDMSGHHAKLIFKVYY